MPKKALQRKSFPVGIPCFDRIVTEKVFKIRMKAEPVLVNYMLRRAGFK